MRIFIGEMGDSNNPSSRPGWRCAACVPLQHIATPMLEIRFRIRPRRRVISVF